MARVDQLDNRLMKIEEQCQPTPSLDHAASRLVKTAKMKRFFTSIPNQSEAPLKMNFSLMLKDVYCNKGEDPIKMKIATEMKIVTKMRIAVMEMRKLQLHQRCGFQCQA